MRRRALSHIPQRAPLLLGGFPAVGGIEVATVYGLEEMVG